MNVTLQYMGQLRHLAGRDEQTVPVAEGDRLSDLLRRVAGDYPDLFGEVALSPSGELASSVMVLINDEHYPRPADWTPRDGDTVTLVPPIAGG